VPGGLPRVPGARDDINRVETWLDRRECICNYICVFHIEFARSVEKDLSGFRTIDRSRGLKAIEAQLSREPCVETRNRKALVNLIPPFEAVSAGLGTADRRLSIFYDVDEDKGMVCVRAVRRKPPHKTTEEIL